MATYNIDDFGAPIDGTTDATSKISTAAANVHGVGGGVLLIPNRTYICNSLDLSSYSDIVIVGSGPKSLLKGNAGTNPWVIKPGAGFRFYEVGIEVADLTNAVGIYIGAVDDIAIEGCEFTSRRTGGVNVYASMKGLRVRHCYFNGDGYGVLINPMSDSSTISHFDISHNYFIGGGTRGDAIEVNNEVNTTILSDGVIEGNIIKDYTATASANGGLGIGVAAGTRITIRGNVITGCREAIHTEGCNQSLVANNIVSGSHRNGITVLSPCVSPPGVDSFDMQIIGNQVYNNNNGFITSGGGVGEGGISCEGADSSKRVLIADNLCYSNAKPGIRISAPVDFVVRGNICRDNTNRGILANGGCTDTYIVGNRCMDTGSLAQAYGIELGGVQSVTRLYDNDMTGNVTAGILESTVSGTYSYNRNDAITNNP